MAHDFGGFSGVQGVSNWTILRSPLSRVPQNHIWYILGIRGSICQVQQKAIILEFGSQQTWSRFSPTTVPDNNRQSGLSPATDQEMSTRIILWAQSNGLYHRKGAGHKMVGHGLFKF